MATRTVSNAGGNWNATTTWVGGVVPTSVDDIVFTSTSGPLTVNVAVSCLSINFTNYTNTIIFNNNISVTTNVNLGAATYTVSGSINFGIAITGTGTLTPGGFTWPCAFATVSTSVITLASNFSVSGNVFLNGGIINSNSLLLGGGLSQNSTNINSGTTTIIFNGTGIWSNSSTGVIRNNVTINTTGTLTISGNIYYNTGTLTYVAGTVITTSSSLNYTASVILDTNGIIWNNINSVNPNSASAVTLLSDLTVSGTFFAGGTSNTTPYNTSVGAKIIILGNIQTGTVGGVSGTADIEILGTGSQTWSGAGTVRNNLTINKSTGTLTISGSVAYSTGTLTYITGTVDTTGSTLNIGTTVTLNTNGITWNNFTISGVSYSITLLSDLNITGLTTFSNTGSITFSTGGNLFNPTGDMSITNGVRTLPNDIYIRNLTLNGNSTPTITANKIYVLGNLTVDGTNSIIGTTEIILGGTGTWSNTSNAELRNNLTIDTNDIITLGTNVYYAVGTFKYIKGKVITKNSTFRINTGPTLINCHKINFNRVIINSGTTLTMNEFFNGSPAFKTNISPLSTLNYNINFQDNFEKIAKFVNITGATITKRNQLLILTDSKKSSSNIGIRYINQSPNGIAKGDPSIQNILTPGLNTFLISDPSMTIK